MRILIDISSILDQYKDRGIGEYTKNIVTEIIKWDKNDTICLVGFLDLKTNLYELKLPKNTKVDFYSLGDIKPSSIFNSKYWKKSFLPILQKVKPDIYFSPTFERGISRGPWKNIYFIHDIIPIKTNSYSQKSLVHNFIKKFSYKRRLRKVLKNSDLILVNSKHTKYELIKYAKISKHKIIPTPLAAKATKIPTDKSKHLNKILLKKFNINDNYLLYYGGIEENKNLENLLKSVKVLKKQYPSIKLIIVSEHIKNRLSGKPIPKNTKARKLLSLRASLDIEDNIIFLEKQTKENLLYLLKNARLFVHVSKQEGFGIAVLEALSYQIPSVISDIPAYKENFQEGTVFTNPTLPDSIADSIASLLSDEKLYQKLKIDSEIYTQKFSWKKTALKTIEVFHRKENNVIQKNNSITFVSPFFFPFKGGAENYTLDIASRLTKSKVNVDVLTSQIPDTNPVDIKNKIKITRFKCLNNSYYLRFYPGLLKALLNNKANVIHVQGFGFIWQELSLIIKKFFSKIPPQIICTPHGPFMTRDKYSLPQLILKHVFLKIQKLYICWLYDKIIIVNPNQSKWIKKTYKIPQSKIKFLPIGITQEHFKKLTTLKVEEKYKLKNKIVLTYLGRFHEYKGVMDILQALSMTNKNNIHMIFMGADSGNLSNMRKFIQKNKLEKYISILIKPTDNLRNQILQISEIFILPSYWEAYGISILEAMAHKNAIITTKTEGGQHLIKHGVNGFLINYNKPKELASSIQKLIHNPTIRKEMIENNYKKAKALQWDNIWDEYKELYNL